MKTLLPCSILVVVFTSLPAACTDDAPSEEPIAAGSTAASGGGGAGGNGSGGVGNAGGEAALDPTVVCPEYCTSREALCGPIADCEPECIQQLKLPTCGAEMDAWVACFTEEAADCGEAPAACVEQIEAFRECTNEPCIGDCVTYSCDAFTFKNECVPIAGGLIECTCTMDGFFLGACVEDQKDCPVCCSKFGVPPLGGI